MMTDVDRWKTFLSEFDIEFTELDRTDRTKFTGEGDIYADWSKVATGLQMEEGDRNVNGHFGHCTEVCFDRDGKFLWIGAWAG